MPSSATLLAFALVSLGMVLTPDPNTVYLISRSITQGRVAGLKKQLKLLSSRPSGARAGTAAN